MMQQNSNIYWQRTFLKSGRKRKVRQKLLPPHLHAHSMIAYGYTSGLMYKTKLTHHPAQKQLRIKTQWEFCFACYCWIWFDSHCKPSSPKDLDSISNMLRLIWKFEPACNCVERDYWLIIYKGSPNHNYGKNWIVFGLSYLFFFSHFTVWGSFSPLKKLLVCHCLLGHTYFHSICTWRHHKKIVREVF